tara:strand:+ start:115 stop:801 length:687 start_codon:yes stop_codon:yes gene_type:complete
MKIAIQLSGQLRVWQESYLHWKKIQEYFSSNNIDVDIHLCTWKEDYTKKINFDNLTTSNLIKLENNILTKVNEDDKYKMRRGIKPINLLPLSYQQYWGSRFRRLYQKENNIEYDFIILSRPDCIIRNFEHIFDLKDFIAESFSTIFIPHGVRNSVGFKPNLPSRFCNDYLCIGTEDSINLFSNGFLYSYIQSSQSFISTNHTYPAMTCMKTNLHTQDINLTLNLLGER